MALLLVQSADIVAAKAIAARGGIKRIKSVRGERFSGKISIVGGSSGTFTVEKKRPGMMRETVTFGDKSMVRTTNGTTGWVVGSLRDLSTPQPVSAEELHSLAESADLDGPLIDYQKIELAGKEKVEKRLAFKLVIYLKNRGNCIEYIDTKSHLERKRQSLVNGNMVETYFRDYREIKGLMYAFEIDSGSQKIVLDKVEVNPKLDAARFEKP
jgi:hypothetical protein